ncbi:MAG: helix-turn-helix transcriptional regulator [Candidatus Magnetobacterium sp. LHC-1]|nr:helix-turn-helix transcriptional regulator [Nitrospirota bacterium]
MKSVIRDIISANIRRFIEQSGMKYEEVGLKMGYRQDQAESRISQYCTGYRSPDKRTIAKFAKVLNRPEEDFYVNDGEVNITLPAFNCESTMQSKDEEMLLKLKKLGIDSPETLDALIKDYINAKTASNENIADIINLFKRKIRDSKK